MLSHKADPIDILSMDLLFVFEGYTVDASSIIVLVLAHDYEQVKEVSSDESNGISVAETGLQYASGTRACFALASLIRSQRYTAHAYPRPSADVLFLVSPAIATGLGDVILGFVARVSHLLSLSKSTPC